MIAIDKAYHKTVSPKPDGIPNLDKCNILKDYNRAIVIGSGPSMNKYDRVEDLPRYTPNTIIITVNFGCLKYKSHICFFQDAPVLRKFLTVSKDTLPILACLNAGLYKHKYEEQEFRHVGHYVDYVYSIDSNAYATKMTLPSAISWVVYNKLMPVYIYGFDGKNPETKFYDSYIKPEEDPIAQREQSFLDDSESWIMKRCDGLLEYLYNCNPDSNYTLIQKDRL